MRESPAKCGILGRSAKFERLPITKQVPQTASIIKMVILKNVYLFRSSPKINCRL